MLRDFVAVLRDFYFIPYIECISIFVWICAAGMSIRLLCSATSLKAKIILRIACLFCAGISLITFLAFGARAYVYGNWHLSDSPNLVNGGKVSKFQVPVYGTEDAKDLILIKYALEFPEVDFAKPHSIRIFDDKSLATILTFGEVVDGHSHCFKNHENICLKKSGLSLMSLWHEIDHIDAMQLPMIAITDWLVIASYGDGFKYNLGTNINDHGFPKNGLWTGYGATKFVEDMAEWRSVIYFCLYLECNPQANPFIYIEDKDDFRYALKLGWLLEWRRITPGQYVKIKKLMLSMGFKFKP